MWTLIWFLMASCSGHQKVLLLEVLTLELTGFDNLSYMGWYHINTSELRCIHSMWELCLNAKQLLNCSPCSECIKFVAICLCDALAISFFFLANKGIYVSY